MPGLGGTTNNYEILAQLASGGMAEIFLARVTAVGGVERHVVLKRILPAYRDDQQFVTMFLDEARLQAQLRHPNIAQLHDVGRLGSSYFYTMEYVHGETVQSLMRKALTEREPIPLQHVLTIAAGVASALHHAHLRVGSDGQPLNIVHRDVSPANVMITFDGVVKLLDFGVAKSRGRRLTDTHAGVVKGKVAYLTPEQIGGAVLDGRSDLFALGICIYELVTLHALFARETDLATLAAIVQEQVPPPSYFRRDVPPEIDALVTTALSKDREARFRSADAMHEAIEAVAARTKLSMSPTALGRNLTKLFGQRREPWLDADALAPITVTGDIIEATDAVPRFDPAVLQGSEVKSLEVKIKKVRPITLRKPNKRDFDEGEETIPEEPTLYDGLTSEMQETDRQPRVTLPMASEHPQWETTVVRSPLPPGLDLEESRRTLEDFSSQVATPLGPIPELMRPTIPRTNPPANPTNRPVPLSIESARAHAYDRPTTPVPQRVPGWTPANSSSPVRPQSQTRWNVPRLIISIAALVAIVAVIWFVAN